MGKLENKLRRKWQDYGGAKASIAEQSFYEIFESLFVDTDLQIFKKPNKFNKVYVDYPLSEEEMKEIFVPEEKITKHGFTPDCIIRNNSTGKEIYIEIKRQDGWVENKTRKHGRGNAHERFCKYFTPGLLKLMRAQSGIQFPYFPFWIVFQGDITRDICRVREIRFWFDGNNRNITFWRDNNNPQPVIDHFINNILPLLE